MAVTKKRRQYTEKSNMIRAIKDAGVSDIPYIVAKEPRSRFSNYLVPVFTPQTVSDEARLEGLGFRFERIKIDAA